MRVRVTKIDVTINKTKFTYRMRHRVYTFYLIKTDRLIIGSVGWLLAQNSFPNRFLWTPQWNHYIMGDRCHHNQRWLLATSQRGGVTKGLGMCHSVFRHTIFICRLQPGLQWVNRIISAVGRLIRSVGQLSRSIKYVGGWVWPFDLWPRSVNPGDLSKPLQFWPWLPTDGSVFLWT